MNLILTKILLDEILEISGTINYYEITQTHFQMFDWFVKPWTRRNSWQMVWAGRWSWQDPSSPDHHRQTQQRAFNHHRSHQFSIWWWKDFVIKIFLTFVPENQWYGWHWVPGDKGLLRQRIDGSRFGWEIGSLHGVRIR